MMNVAIPKRGANRMWGANRVIQGLLKATGASATRHGILILLLSHSTTTAAQPTEMRCHNGGSQQAELKLDVENLGSINKQIHTQNDCAERTDGCVDGSCGEGGTFCSVRPGDILQVTVRAGYSYSPPFTGVYADIYWDPVVFELLDMPTLTDPAESVFAGDLRPSGMSARFFLEPVSGNGQDISGFKWSLGPVTQQHGSYADAVLQRVGHNTGDYNSQLFTFSLIVKQMPPALFSFGGGVITLTNGTWAAMRDLRYTPDDRVVHRICTPDYPVFVRGLRVAGDLDADGRISPQEVRDIILEFLNEGTSAAVCANLGLGDGSGCYITPQMMRDVILAYLNQP